MTLTRSKDEEQSNETYSSNATNSDLAKQNTELKTSKQQSLIIAGKQLTLQVLPSSTKRDSEAMEDEIEILVHRTSYLDPRTLLCIIENHGNQC